MAGQILFDKLRFIDRLKSAGIDDNQARAHAEAMDEALRESVATKSDLRMEISLLEKKIDRLETKIDLAVRDMTIRMEAIAIALFAALASIKFFG